MYFENFEIKNSAKLKKKKQKKISQNKLFMDLKR